MKDERTKRKMSPEEAIQNDVKCEAPRLECGHCLCEAEIDQCGRPDHAFCQRCHEQEQESDASPEQWMNIGAARERAWILKMLVADGACVRSVAAKILDESEQEYRSGG